jgi:beta-glucanase (GH16 family)
MLELNRIRVGAMVAIGVALLLAPVARVNAAGWQLAWSDEFNGAAGTSPNGNNWVFETGGGGWGNNELEVYTNSTNNARLDGAGNLIIEARRNGSGYTSARLKTQGKMSVTYGKIEARIAVPKGQGLWPAFWALGTNIGSVGWPKCGEIDIMEHVNTNDTNYGTIHWYNNGQADYGGNTSAAPINNFHTYTIDWNTSLITWYVDGRSYVAANIANNINGTDEFHKPFFLLLNLAVGGNWPGSPNSSTPFPAQYKIDYVRVYRWVN